MVVVFGRTIQFCPMRNLKSLNCISDPNPILHSKNEFGSWAQSVEYEPRLEDDGKTLACSLAAASKGAADSITMRMLMNTMEGKSGNYLQAFENVKRLGEITEKLHV